MSLSKVLTQKFGDYYFPEDTGTNLNNRRPPETTKIFQATYTSLLPKMNSSADEATKNPDIALKTALPVLNGNPKVNPHLFAVAIYIVLKYKLNYETAEETRTPEFRNQLMDEMRTMWPSIISHMPKNKAKSERSRDISPTVQAEDVFRYIQLYFEFEKNEVN